MDEKPTEHYGVIGGLDKQIQELVEAVVLPVTHAEKFKKLGIKPPKGVLLYGPPGTGKTLIARACAAQTNATFLKLAGGLSSLSCVSCALPEECSQFKCINPPKGMLLYSPPGTGKTLAARLCSPDQRRLPSAGT